MSDNSEIGGYIVAVIIVCLVIWIIFDGWNILPVKKN